jgi:hypothetical protein
MSADTKTLKRLSPLTGVLHTEPSHGMVSWTEREHQESFFRWVEEQILNGKTHYITLGAIPNGNGQVGKVTLGGYRTLGFRVGMPDIYWYLPRGGYHGLFIELKTLKCSSGPRKEQYLMCQLLKKNGYLVEFCHGVASAIAAVERYDSL